MFKPKLSNILSGLNRLLDKLDDFVDSTIEELGKNEVEIVKLENNKKELKNEIEKATVVRSNISKLVGE